MPGIPVQSRFSRVIQPLPQFLWMANKRSDAYFCLGLTLFDVLLWGLKSFFFKCNESEA